MRRERFIDFQFALRLRDGTVRWTSASGEPFYDADGEFTGYHGVSRDITERRVAEDSIRHLATHDTLTGLPNRTLFIEELGRSMREARHDGRQLALLFIDLDHFKIINDTLGHEAGDRLLAEVGRRLAASLRGNDFVARLGGDEFCAILTEVADATAARSIAERMLAAIAPAFDGVTASIGLSLYPDDATEPAVLLRYADDAMYRVKARGKNAVGMFAAVVPL
jgi:diguanylate cyclase (GGDEF)-like protein